MTLVINGKFDFNINDIGAEKGSSEQHKNKNCRWKTAIVIGISAVITAIFIARRVKEAKDYSSLSKCLRSPETTLEMPVITSPGHIENDIPFLPKISLMKIANLRTARDIIEDEEHMFYTKDAYKQILNMPKRPIQSKETADLLVQALANEKAFPWEHTPEGCSQRSDLSQIVLNAMGVSKDSMMTQIVSGPHQGVKFRDETTNWNYHAATAIKLMNGSQFILDPSTNANKAQGISDWIEASGFGPWENCEVNERPITYNSYYSKVCTYFSKSYVNMWNCDSWKKLSEHRNILNSLES